MIKSSIITTGSPVIKQKPLPIVKLLLLAAPHVNVHVHGLHIVGFIALIMNIGTYAYRPLHHSQASTE